MNPWRAPTDEEYKYIASKRKSGELLCWILFTVAIIFLLFFMMLSLNAFIESILDRDWGRMIGAPLVNILPILGVIFSVRLIIKNDRSDKRFKNREISITYGIVKDRKTWTTGRYRVTCYHLSIGLDDGTVIEQSVLPNLYHVVQIMSKIIVVHDLPVPLQQRGEYWFIPMPGTPGFDDAGSRKSHTAGSKNSRAAGRPGQ